MSRLSDAMAYHSLCQSRFDHTKTPKGQKFPAGTRVRIADDLGPSMSHFPSGVNGVVEFTYKQMYGSDDTKSYSIDIDGRGSVSWFKEHQLTKIEENKDA